MELGDRKESITTEDLYYIAREYLDNKKIEEKVEIENYYVCNVLGMKPVATISLKIDGVRYEQTSSGDGQYDAFMKALHKIYDQRKVTIPKLEDYVVTIPPGGKTDALVETVITWNDGIRSFKTRGLDLDQTSAAIKATRKMLNIIEL